MSGRRRNSGTLPGSRRLTFESRTFPKFWPDTESFESREVRSRKDSVYRDYTNFAGAGVGSVAFVERRGGQMPLYILTAITHLHTLLTYWPNRKELRNLLNPKNNAQYIKYLILCE